MNRITRLFIAFLLVLLMMNFILPSTWYLFESKVYGYKIEFPKKPSESPQEVDSDMDDAKWIGDRIHSRPLPSWVSF